MNNHLFLTAKPMIYLVNLSEKDFIRKKNKWLVPMKPASCPMCYIRVQYYIWEYMVIIYGNMKYMVI